MIVSTFLNLRFLHSKSSIQNLLFLLCSVHINWIGFYKIPSYHIIKRCLMVTAMTYRYQPSKLMWYPKGIVLKSITSDSWRIVGDQRFWRVRILLVILNKSQQMPDLWFGKEIVNESFFNKGKSISQGLPFSFLWYMHKIRIGFKLCSWQAVESWKLLEIEWYTVEITISFSRRMIHAVNPDN